MLKPRLLLPLIALAAVSLVWVGCGGVSKNSVAKVDGHDITKKDLNHWLQAGATSAGQPALQPPQFTACIAQLRKQQPKPAKGKKAVTVSDTVLRRQCSTQYDSFKKQAEALLINRQWIASEAKRQKIKVSDAEFNKYFEAQKKQAFKTDAEFQAWLKKSKRSLEDIKAQLHTDLLTTKIRDRATKGTSNVTDKQISDYYNKNKARFAQPERRDLEIVLTKDKAKGDQALKEVKSGKAWKDVAKQLSTDQASKGNGGKVAAVSKGQLEKNLDAAVFKANKGQILGPIKTQFGFYVFRVTTITKATQQTMAQSKAVIKQLLQSQNQDASLKKFVEGYQKRWKAKTECAKGYIVDACKNAPKPKKTGAAGGANQPK